MAGELSPNYVDDFSAISQKTDGVERSADTEAIKRAYRSKCLELHPDRIRQRGQEVTDAHRARFQHMKQAYDVLIDPKRRDLYDQLGETGMMMIEDPSNLSMEKVMNNFLNMRNRERLKLVMFVVLFVGAMLLFPILLCAKIDDDISASWAVVWIPLWIYDAVGLYYYCMLVSLGKIQRPEGIEEELWEQPLPLCIQRPEGIEEELWEDPSPLYLRVLGLAQWSLFILQQIFLTLRLDSNITWSWACVLVPWLVWESATLCATLLRAMLPLPREDDQYYQVVRESATLCATLLRALLPLPREDDQGILEEGEGEGAQDAKRAAVMLVRQKARGELFIKVTRLLQGIMLILRLDHDITWDWWAVWWPTYAYVAFHLASLLLVYLQSLHLLSDLTANEAGTLSEEDAMKASGLFADAAAAGAQACMEFAQMLRSQAKAGCFSWGVLLVMVLLAVAKMAGADFSTFIIFIPVFAAAGCLVCTMSCLICCMRARASTAALAGSCDGDLSDMDMEAGEGAPGAGGAGGASSSTTAADAPLPAEYTPYVGNYKPPQADPTPTAPVTELPPPPTATSTSTTPPPATSPQQPTRVPTPVTTIDADID
ncbi:hypothetical protein JKP88DRAFT_353980 [Tribonema minus]|uniref:J domain-containing protein n=1 Tax=Tribonema minus TaxID=303371 RepID=A0A836CHD5_9STRA|nr:hypothetical protein JKP88DRAFT_353980 [Tribonema minus]